MKKVLVLMLLLFALGESFAHQGRLFRYLKNGDMCFQSIQCRSGCCQRPSVTSLARCADKSAENQECGLQNVYGVYNICPCENGLTCDADRRICEVDRQH